MDEAEGAAARVEQWLRTIHLPAPGMLAPVMDIREMLTALRHARAERDALRDTLIEIKAQCWDECSHCDMAWELADDALRELGADGGAPPQPPAGGAQ